MRLFIGKTPRELLADKLSKTIEENLDFSLEGCALRIPNRDWHILSMALSRNWLKEERFLQAVHEGICRVGRQSYEDHISNPDYTPPDHVRSPAALGYAIKHGAITKHEVSRIKFDHGHTATDAIGWSINIFDQALEEIQNYKKDGCPTNIPSFLIKDTNTSDCC